MLTETLTEDEEEIEVTPSFRYIETGETRDYTLDQFLLIN